MTFSETLASLREYGFWRVTYHRLRLDVFLPIVDFYAAAQARRRRVELAGRPVMIWDAESLIVFKLMLFRRKDIADVEGILAVGSCCTPPERSATLLAIRDGGPSGPRTGAASLSSDAAQPQRRRYCRGGQTATRDNGTSLDN